ncbi:hypothetical protein ACKFKF_24025 [Phormidesmis sp. 146-12]
MPFDDADLAKGYEGFMSDYFTTTYGGKEELFLPKLCLSAIGKINRSPLA